MGLLDEAIRQHLELKRRHGADPTEVARQEHEALGPVRREAAEPAEHAPEAADHEEAIELEPEPAPSAEGPVVHEPEPAVEDEQTAIELEQPTQQFSIDELEIVEEEPAPAPALRPEPEPEPELDDDDAPEVVPADEEPVGDDVLEETPDFLQETPEHDRLWFEQKPPRDFDF